MGSYFNSSLYLSFVLYFKVKVPLPDEDEITPANPLMEPRPAASRPKPKKGILHCVVHLSVFFIRTP